MHASRRHSDDVIVVTGATGNVGHRVAQRLLATGHPVRVVARTAERLMPLAARGADVRTGLLGDRVFAREIFRGAKAAFLLTPADVSAPNVNAEQIRNVESVAAAIKASEVPNVVLLSSWGAELSERVGGIVACHHFERLIDDIAGLNAVSLRPVWFMENFLWNIGLIKMADINGLAIDPDVRFPIIATPDIAAAATDHLQRLQFTGHSVQYLNGPADYTMPEVTRILGSSVGRPNMRYVRFPERILRKGLIDNGGLSPDAAELVIQTNRGINSGLVKAEQRSQLNTTPTTLEKFAASTFAPAFEAAAEPSLAHRLAGRVLRSVVRAARMSGAG